MKMEIYRRMAEGGRREWEGRGRRKWGGRREWREKGGGRSREGKEGVRKGTRK